LGWQGQLLKVELEWSLVKLGRGRTLGQELGYKLGVQAVEGTGARTEVAGLAAEESMVVFVEKARGTGK
jgi:hypothetical protein